MENKINYIERGLDGDFDEIFQKRQNIMYIDRKEKLQQIVLSALSLLYSSYRWKKHLIWFRISQKI